MSSQPCDTPWAGAAVATIARSRRLIRLRAVAGPTARPTANATRNGTAEGSLR